ncbi:MAG TPA: oxidoreductase [Actinomycetota bacterium]|nr:oxidoreductase [Actinomycetota bacterium]
MTSRAVLITGCSTGIGRATAERMARNGWTVYASARRLETISDLRGCRTLALDVCDEGSMRAAVEQVEREQGAVGVLVNNAGYAQDAAFESVPMDEVRRQFETNVFGLVRLTQLVLPGMRRQRWGRVINVSSMGGRLTLPGAAYYHATKHAVEALSDALRYEVAPFGVRVSVIEPGLIKTAFGRTAAAAVQGVDQTDDPYAAFNQGVAAMLMRAYEGPLSVFASGPGSTARAIEHAASSRLPRTRYRVTLGARSLLMTRRLLPDRAWDTLLKLVYPTPRP